MTNNPIRVHVLLLLDTKEMISDIFKNNGGSKVTGFSALCQASLLSHRRKISFCMLLCFVGGLPTVNRDAMRHLPRREGSSTVEGTAQTGPERSAAAMSRSKDGEEPTRDRPGSRQLSKDWLFCRGITVN